MPREPPPNKKLLPAPTGSAEAGREPGKSGASVLGLRSVEALISSLVLGFASTVSCNPSWGPVCLILRFFASCSGNPASCRKMPQLGLLHGRAWTVFLGQLRRPPGAVCIRAVRSHSQVSQTEVALVCRGRISRSESMDFKPVLQPYYSRYLVSALHVPTQS